MFLHEDGIHCISACDNCRGNLCNNGDKTLADEESSSDEESVKTMYMFDADEFVDEEVVMMDVENIDPSTLNDEVDDENFLWFTEETIE